MIRKIGFSLIIAIVVSVISGQIFIKSSVKDFLTQPILIEKNELFEVKRGTSLQSVLKQVEQRHWINSSWVVRFIHRLKPELTNIKVGTYQVSPGESLQSLLDDIVSGREYQFSVTFVEGSRFSDWRKTLAATNEIGQTITDMSEQQIAEKLGLDKNKLEGLFLAETYHFTAGTNDIDILNRAHKKLEMVLARAWKDGKKNLPLKTPYDALILASIIEKETSVETERKQIASVFINRLRKGMRLQTDPTVIYGMGDKYNGNIRKKDLQTATPYNTYVIRGLPPTPIAMPGEMSIEAALQPDDTHYLYFVASGKGGHVFSNTLSEHNRAVYRYLKQLRQSH